MRRLALALARDCRDVVNRCSVADRLRSSCLWLAVLLVSTAGTATASQADPEPTLWSHNGSVLYLVAKGTSREFRYKEPRPGMLQAGAYPGALLFRGQSTNHQYSGTAFIFNSQCGQLPYQVSGPILDGYERVVLTGQAPQVGPDCRITGYREDTLEFRLVKQNEREIAVPATAPVTKPTASAALEIEAIELASNFILQAKLNNPRVFGPSETPAGLATHGAAWTADEGVGTVEIITEEQRKGLDVATAVAAADSTDCGGKFASGRVSELVDSDVVFRGFASCEDSSGTRVTQHFIVPRPAGGFVIFSLSSIGPASQPPSVTEGENLVALRRAASVSVERK